MIATCEGPGGHTCAALAFWLGLVEAERQLLAAERGVVTAHVRGPQRMAPCVLLQWKLKGPTVLPGLPQLRAGGRPSSP